MQIGADASKRRTIYNLVTPTLGGVGSYLRRAIFFLLLRRSEASAPMRRAIFLVTTMLGGVGFYASGYLLLITLLLYALMETANRGA